MAANGPEAAHGREAEATGPLSRQSAQSVGLGKREPMRLQFEAD